MTRLRLGALAVPDDLQVATFVRQGARRATLPRAAIGLLSLILIALGSLLAT
jgi:hypothetical protein